MDAITICVQQKSHSPVTELPGLVPEEDGHDFYALPNEKKLRQRDPGGGGGGGGGGQGSAVTLTFTRILRVYCFMCVGRPMPWNVN